MGPHDIGEAAREDDDIAAGLGGHLYHLWCYMALSQEMMDAFDTPHLEFIQAGMLAITHSQRLAHADSRLGASRRRCPRHTD
eukprot:3263407-Prymnesium_polylepis.1